MANFFEIFEKIFYEVYYSLGVSVEIPIVIDVGDEGTPGNFAGGIVYDSDTGEEYVLLNATSPWWRDGKSIKEKMTETLRHEFRHLCQRQYLIDHYGFDDDICRVLMGANELYGGYENNPYEIDAFGFETSTQDWEEGLEWIDQIIAH